MATNSTTKNNNNTIVADTRTIEEFVEIIVNLSRETARLVPYDSFAAVCIKDVIELLLSKNTEYVNMVSEQNNRNSQCSCEKTDDIQNIAVPDDVKKDVDSIIDRVRKSLQK